MSFIRASIQPHPACLLVICSGFPPDRSLNIVYTTSAHKLSVWVNLYVCIGVYLYTTHQSHNISCQLEAGWLLGSPTPAPALPHLSHLLVVVMSEVKSVRGVDHILRLVSVWGEEAKWPPCQSEVHCY